MWSAQTSLVHVTSQEFAPGSHPGVYRTVRGMVGHGPQVVLCTERPGYADVPLRDAERAELAREQIFVHTLDLASLRKAYPPRRLLAAIRGAHGRPRAIVAHLGKNAFRSLSLGGLGDAPILTVFHGEDANLEVRDPKYRERFERWFAAPGSVALGVADHLTAKVVAAGFPAEQAFTHHLGLDLSEYVPRTSYQADGPLRFALSGRLMEVKGHRTALQALVAASDVLPDCELHLFGQGPLKSSLYELVQKLGLEERVYFHGAVPVDTLRERLRTMDVLLQPSEVDDEGREEGVPNSILEAMALGLPVLATRHGGIAEAVVDGETGRLVAERSIDELVAGLREVRDAGLREGWGRAGRARVEAEYDQGLRGADLVSRIAEARAHYDAIPRVLRRASWEKTLAGYVELPSAIGRRERLRWPARLAAAWWRGDIS